MSGVAKLGRVLEVKASVSVFTNPLLGTSAAGTLGRKVFRFKG